jgi:glycine betaine/proline transport system permease protein
MKNDIEKNELAASIDGFAETNVNYYRREFEKIQQSEKLALTWNSMAAIFGPLWGAIRGLWGYFWIFLVLEMFAFVQIGRGLWGELGADKIERYERLITNIAKREQQAADLIAAGDSAAAADKLNIANNLKKAAETTLLEAEAASQQAFSVLMFGLAFFAIIKLLEGFYANYAYERQYLRWRSNPKIQTGLSTANAIWGIVLIICILPLTLLRYTVTKADELLASLTGGFLGDTIPISEFPVKREYFSPLAAWGDQGFDWLASRFGNVFDGITYGIRTVLDGIEILLIGTPWPVVMVVIVVAALRLAGIRVAIFTAASLAYLSMMGLWEMSMITVALIGTGAFLCVLFGIPLGIWFGKSQRAYRTAEPVLDFMQTMPAFVYLIPIIAFFGTGKPPGVLATLIFAMPPVIRLTALGIRGVPEATKEAAVAFGCSRRQLMMNVEIPLAMPSIMTGINQTILMSLSMVVIASLIGADGLGALILESLQYAAKGQGLLGGLAILVCAMVIDRIAQGAYRKK